MKKFILIAFMLISTWAYAQNAYRASWKDGSEMKKYEQFILFNPIDSSFAFSDYNKKFQLYEVLKGRYSFDGEYLTLFYDDRGAQKLKFFHTEEYDYIIIGKKKFLLKCVIC